MKDVKKVIRRYQVRKILILILVIAVGLYIVYDRFFVEENYENAISHTKVEENKKDEVVLSMLPPESMSPVTSTSADVQYLSNLIYSRLFRFDETMTPVQDLVSEYKISGSRVKMKLKDAKWHKGGKVTAEDIAFTVDTIRAYGKKGPHYNKIEKIKGVYGGGSNVTVEFNSPYDVSLAYLSFPIVSKDTYRESSEKSNSIIPDGSGMYRLSEYNKGKEIKFKPDEDYYDEIPRSSLIVKLQKKSSDFATLVETSNISLYFTKDISTETDITKENMEFTSFPGNSVDFIGFNFKNSPVRNGYLRKALVHAIDMDDIREDFYYDSMVDSDSLYIPGFLGDEDEKVYDEDIEKSVQYLNKADIKDKDGDGIREIKKGHNIKLDILVDKSKTERVDTAEGLKESFDDIGIDAKVIKADRPEYMSRLKEGQFDLFIGGLNVDETMDFRSLLATGGKFNFTGFSDKQLDYNLNKLMSGQDNDKKKEILKEIKNTIYDKAPYYCIGYHKFDVISAPALEGEVAPNFVNPYGGIEGWYSIYEKVLTEDQEDNAGKEKEKQ